MVDPSGNYILIIIRDLAYAHAFFRHGRQPEENILHARTVDGVPLIFKTTISSRETIISNVNVVA